MPREYQHIKNMRLLKGDIFISYISLPDHIICDDSYIRVKPIV